MRTLDFGKNKGKILADCEESYLKWLVSHEQVLAKRNRWAARDAKFILDRRAQEALIRQAEQIVAAKAQKVALLAGKAQHEDRMTAPLNGNRGFQLMR